MTAEVKLSIITRIVGNFYSYGPAESRDYVDRYARGVLDAVASVLGYQEEQEEEPDDKGRSRKSKKPLV